VWHGNIPTRTLLPGANAGGVRVGRNRDFVPYRPIWLHCVLSTVPCNGKCTTLSLPTTDHGEFMTLVAEKRQSLLMAGNNDEVYDKKLQRYAEENVTQW